MEREHLRILAERLIEMSTLILYQPDEFRKEFMVNDKDWKAIVSAATDRINGREHEAWE